MRVLVVLTLLSWCLASLLVAAQEYEYSDEITFAEPTSMEYSGAAEGSGGTQTTEAGALTSDVDDDFGSLLEDDDLPPSDISQYEKSVLSGLTEGEATPYDGSVYREGQEVYVNLTVGVCRYTEHLNFTTRCYNGKFLGPAINVKQGDTVYITINNTLGEETWFPEPDNTMHWPNHTSLHVHGLHISNHEDNIFAHVRPGDSRTYTYTILSNHYPGTHWYHAHFHGSSAYQISAGLHGAFIVEPADPSFFPEFLANLKPSVLVVSNLRFWNKDNLEWVGMVQYHTLIKDDMDMNLEIETAHYNNTFVVNGKYQPSIEIAVNEWQWLRIINAGSSLSIPLILNSTGCQHYAIALDGIFLEEVFSQDVYYIFPGARLDLAVLCDESGVHEFQYHKDYDNLWYFKGVDSSEDQQVFSLNATTESDTVPLSIEDWEAPAKPDYLQDLVSVPDEQIADRLTIASVFLDQSMDYFGFSNGKDTMHWSGRDNSSLFTLEIGKVYEITFTTDLAVHPIHIHTNHMQVISDVQVAWSEFDTFALHKETTWRDTIYTSYERNVTVRMKPDRFTGSALVHCHYVVHADRGMMAELLIADSKAPETGDTFDDDAPTENDPNVEPVSDADPSLHTEV